MPQRVNSKSDIGNTKIASDVYDVNNCFLTDQGWVYRHYKGDPADTTNIRYWDEILVAGEVISDRSPSYIAGDADAIAIGDANDTVDEILYSTEESEGSLLVGTPTFEGAPDDIKDIEYSAHTYSVVTTDLLTGEDIVTPTLKPATAVPSTIYNEYGTPISPGPSPDGYAQYPEDPDEDESSPPPANS